MGIVIIPIDFYINLSEIEEQIIGNKFAGFD